MITTPSGVRVQQNIKDKGMKFFQTQTAISLDKPIPADPGLPNTDTKFIGISYTGWMGAAEITLHVMKNGTMSIRHGRKGYIAINRQAVNDLRKILGVASDTLAPTEFFSNAKKPNEYVGWVGDVPVVFYLADDRKTASLRVGGVEQRDHLVLPICEDILNDMKEALTESKVELAS
jgi:hypothetical protein